MMQREKCPFCERECQLIRHHAQTRRESDDVIRMCSDCERCLHALYDNRSLRSRPDLQTIDGLKEDARFMRAVSYVRRTPIGTFIRMRQRKERWIKS